MKVVELPIQELREASLNPNAMAEPTRGRLSESIDRYGMIQNLVVRRTGDGTYEVLSGNHRVGAMRDKGIAIAPGVIVDPEDSNARLLAQALNRVQGEVDLGLG